MQLLHLITALFLSNREHHLEPIFLSTDDEKDFFEAIFLTVDGWALVARKLRIDKILPHGHRFTVIRLEAATGRNLNRGL